MSGLYALGSRGREALDFATGARDLDIGAHPQRGVWWHLEDNVRLALALEDLLGCGPETWRPWSGNGSS